MEPVRSVQASSISFLTCFVVVAKTTSTSLESILLCPVSAFLATTTYEALGLLVDDTSNIANPVSSQYMFPSRCLLPLSTRYTSKLCTAMRPVSILGIFQHRYALPGVPSYSTCRSVTHGGGAETLLTAYPTKGTPLNNLSPGSVFQPMSCQSKLYSVASSLRF